MAARSTANARNLPATKPRAPTDHEMSVMTRFCRDLATLPPPARRRVMAYVCARLESLPVIAAVGGGTDGGEQNDLLDAGIPQMPPLHGAADAA